MYNIFLP